MNKMAEGSSTELTAEQKFNMMLSGQLFDQGSGNAADARKQSDPYAEPAVDDAIMAPKTTQK